ncbi:aspartic proteinase CDR1-like [Coffea eugenioides]|uniref:aspartic proteinase CDR1-like n=1 Tax=Coffea eugenioides TaxID=49369 RepID=UPI000F609726|nr:aspartic proteinase CDR1-like [Coffea eugenioides]
MARNCPVFSLFSKLSLLVFINLCLYSLIEGKTGGFSTHLIHRDSPKSPLYNPSNSHFERLHEAFHRSSARAEYFKKRISHSRSNNRFSRSSSNPFRSTTIPADGEYLMKVSIGTPPVDLLAIADTGSDMTWIECKPCNGCFNQHFPLFDPNKTKSYRHLLCNSSLCWGPGVTCEPENKCGYSELYADGSSSDGDLSTETFTFESSSGRKLRIPNVVFGCTHKTGGGFGETASGIVGLGGGALSIIRQWTESIGGKFSYCVVPRDSNSSSTITFGSNAALSGNGVVSTPLIRQFPDTYYYVNLIGFSVANMRIPYKEISNLGNSFPNDTVTGNIFIDSGTMLTYVPLEFYQKLESDIIKTARGTRVTDPSGFYGLCYKVEKRLQIPKIVARFAGADILLPPNGTFLEVYDGVVCLAIVPVDPADNLAIFGNLLQVNHLIEYDLVNNKVSFLPIDCTKYK